MRRYIFPILLLLCAGIFSGQGLEREGARQIGGVRGRAVPTDIADQPPVAWFNYIGNVDNTAGKYFFYGTQSSDREGAIAQYDWYFGDGDSNKTNSPTVFHTYLSSDTFTVKLRVTDSNSATAIKTRDIIVDTVTAPNQKPVALVSVSTIGSRYLIDMSGSYDPDGTISNYAVEVTSGNQSTPATPDTSSNDAFGAIYAAGISGEQLVNVRVQDNDGAWSNYVQDVNFEVPFVVTSSYPIANLNVDIIADRNIEADGFNSADPESNIVSYRFSWGDGSNDATSTEGSAGHTYAADGTYNVTLEVTDDEGLTDTDTDPVTVAQSTNPLADWAGYKTLTIDSPYYKASQTHKDFPLLITGQCLWYDGVWSSAKSNGSDIVIVSMVDSTLSLDRNVVSWDASDSTAEIWVKVPTISPTQKTFRVYYGNPDTTIASANPWRDEYKMVFHFEEDASQSAPVDASGSGHHITSRTGTWVQGDGDEAYGKIGKGLHYNDDGSAEGKKTRLNSYRPTSGSYSISAWVYGTDAWEPIFFTYPQFEMYAGQYFNGTYTLGTSRTRINAQDVNVWWEPHNLAQDTWRHHVFVFDATNDRMYHYYNGQQSEAIYVTDLAEVQIPWTGAYYDYTTDVPIGASSGDTYYSGIFSRVYDYGGNADDENLNGHGDEFRLYEGVLNADWIELEYLNQNDPVSFFGIDPPAPPADTTPPVMLAVNDTYPKTVKVFFDEALDSTIAETDANWDVYPTSGGIDSTKAVTTFDYALSDFSVTMTMTANLAYSTNYTVRSNNIQDDDANAAGVQTRTFTTVNAPSAGAPTITSATSDGADGDSVVLVGTNFGTHGLDIDSGVGSAGWIEQGSSGNTLNDIVATNWASLLDNGERHPRVSTTDKRTGSKSILAEVDFLAYSNWQASMHYDQGSSYDKCFVSFWFKKDIISPTTVSDPHSISNKWFRFSSGTSAGQATNDTPGELYWGAQWRGSTGSWTNISQGALLTCEYNGPGEVQQRSLLGRGV